MILDNKCFELFRWLCRSVGSSQFWFLVSPCNFLIYGRTCGSRGSNYHPPGGRHDARSLRPYAAGPPTWTLACHFVTFAGLFSNLLLFRSSWGENHGGRSATVTSAHWRASNWCGLNIIKFGQILENRFSRKREKYFRESFDKRKTK